MTPAELARILRQSDCSIDDPAVTATVANSRAQTPGGRGRGYTPDAQDFGPPPPVDRAQRLATFTMQYLGWLDVWAVTGCEAEMERVQAACEMLLGRLKEENNG